MTLAASMHQLISTELLCLLGLALVLLKLISTYANGRNKPSYPPLRGPPRPNWLYGVENTLFNAIAPEEFTLKWIDEYGAVFSLPAALGKNRIVLSDPKALGHFYSKDTYGYAQTELSQLFIENLFGRNLLWAEGHDHRRQRKTMSPAFSNAAIRQLSSVFYDSAYKVVAAWDSQTSIEPNTIIEVQGWMNRISLDSIGIAGFGHDFQYLGGVQSRIVELFDTLTSANNFISDSIIIFGQALPFLLRIPTRGNKTMKTLKEVFSVIADGLLEKMRSEKQSVIGKETVEEKSIIGILVKAESGGVDKDEIIAQMSLLLFAGYDTTSITMTWALIELCRNPDVQKRLREELEVFGNDDPTWDQLVSDLPYLDAVVHEVLRLHPSVPELIRVANEDDILPLAASLTLRTGEMVSEIIVPKGSFVVIPIAAINKSSQFWGADAREFRPERWLGLNDAKKSEDLGMKDLPGHRHLMTFSDGPRICLGRAIALTEFKTVLSVLIRNFVFEFPGGTKTEIGRHRGVTLRPKVVGEEGFSVPVRVRRVE